MRDSGQDQDIVASLDQAFKEASSLLVYILINCLERNMGYFEENLKLSQDTQDLLDRGLAYSERNNNRVAYIHFNEAVTEIIKAEEMLIANDEDLLEALDRVANIRTSTLNPLWAEYSSSR
ncbi:hypothetical protein [Salinicola halophilus]|uniref:hypothetical protein n=1 Tax=Salinicola halophilus TaxID=184065 RepID=UPI0013A64994|nr:hypothetical protein [Salinicola halophilus]